MSRIGIVIPAFQPDISTLSSYIESLQTSIGPAVIRVELDDPDDQISHEKCSWEGVTVNRVPRRRGKGAAITDGFESLPSDIDVYASLDADASTSATATRKLLDPVISGEFDIAVGSRRHPNSVVTTHQTTVRRHLGNVFARVGRVLLPVKLYDYQCGAKVITAKGWQNIRGHLYEKGFAWDIEVVSVASILGLRIVEIPIRWEDQPGSTVEIGDAIFDLARALFVVRHRSKALQGHPIHSRFAPARGDALVDLDSGEL